MYTHFKNEELYAMYLAVKKELSLRLGTQNFPSYKIKEAEKENLILLMQDKIEKINTTLGVDVLSKSRVPFLVNVKMALGLYFRELNIPCCVISRAMNKNHATIIYYEKKGLDYIDIQDADFVAVWERVNEILK